MSRRRSTRRGDILPANLPSNPTYRKVNPADAPILILALTSDTVTTPQMYDAASTILQQKLSQVKGVGQVFVGGSSLPAVRVDLNPMALNKYGISLEDVRGVLCQHQCEPAQGTAGRTATRPGRSRPTTSCARPSSIMPLVVAYRSGAAVRLSDVANVQDSVEDLRAAGLVNGKPAVMVIIFRQPGPTSSRRSTASARCCRSWRRPCPGPSTCRSCWTAPRRSAGRCRTSS